MNRIVKVLGLVCVTLLGACGGGGNGGVTGDAGVQGDTVTPSSAGGLVPVLPDQPYDYLSVALPAYFTDDTLAGFAGSADNMPPDNPITNAGATLGRVLFYDTALSINDSVSCSSCHVQALGFSDERVKSVGFQGGLTGRHSMGLANARYYQRGHFFWDERAATLEDQVVTPIQDAVEMGMSLDILEVKLAQLAYYPALFNAAFGSPEVTRDRIAKALAQFVRAMVSYRSKYDEGFGSGFPNFTAQERQGHLLFTSNRTNCAACHRTGAQISDTVHNNGLDAVTIDEGVAGTTGRPGDEARFKAPSLRNIAVRAPYMHDGRFATLEEVVEHYNSGLQDHPNLDNRLRDGNGQPLRMNLTAQEKAALVAFMNTLTDEAMLSDEKFSDPFQPVE